MNRIFVSVFDGELTIPGVSLPASKYSDEVFKATTKGGKYLPRVQLMTSSAKKCKAGEFPINCYAMVEGENYVDLGKSVDVGVLAWRPKALDISGDQVIAVYDPQVDEFGNSTGEFARIEAKSEVKDSGCMYGTEYLLWIPGQKAFATFFMGTKSSRRESPNLKARIGKAATLTSHLIETARYSWYAPLIKPYNGELSNVPTSPDLLMRVVTEFNNPPASEIETVTNASDRDR
jgi:hypothetical protein